MDDNLRDIFMRFMRPAAVFWLGLGAAGLTAPGAFAMTRAELYQAAVPVTDRSESSQAAAFQNAMRIVLIRATGARSAEDDPALAPLVSNARRYVQQYRGTPDNQLWVSFDGAAIERWLTQNGQPLWGHERPMTAAWVAVQSGPQTGSVITAADTSELKASLDAEAQTRGLPLLWPSASDLQRNHLDYAAVLAAPVTTLAEIGKRMGAEGTLVGRANGATATSSVRWTHLFQDHSSEFLGALEGIDRTADLYAGLFAASGSLAPIDIEVVGAGDVKDYAGIQSYLESLTFISHVSVVSLSGDAIRFRLATRGGADSLQRTLTSNGRLQPIAAGEGGVARFQLRR